MEGKKRRGSFLGNDGSYSSGGDFCPAVCDQYIRHSRRVHLRPTFVLLALSFSRVSVSVIDCWLLPGQVDRSSPAATGRRRDRASIGVDRDLSSRPLPHRHL